MQLLTICRTDFEQTERHICRSFLSIGTQERISIRITRAQTYTGTDELRGKWLHHTTEPKGLNRRQKINISLSGPIWSNNFLSLTKRTTKSWINSKWKFLWKKCYWRKYPKPETPTPQRLTHHGRLIQWRTTRGRTHRNKQIPHLPQNRMPVRPSHRRQKISIYHLLYRKAQSHDFPILLTPQLRHNQKAWENWQADLQFTYKFSRQLALTAHQRLRPWLPSDTTAGWEFLQYQDRVLHIPPKWWSSYRPQIRR